MAHKLKQPRTPKDQWLWQLIQRLGVRIKLAHALPGWVPGLNSTVSQVLANRVAGKPGSSRYLTDR